MTSGAEIAARLDFDAAADAVSRLAWRTPLLPAAALSETLGREVLLKPECLQVTGSFKVRGAAARLAALSADERSRGVMACSSGNHGRAVAFVANALGIPAEIYVPEWVDPVKLAGIRAQRADAVLAGATFDEAEERAISVARASGRTFVSAYDDPWVIAGQGTIALEILEDAGATPCAILAPLSGGGLIGGIAAVCRRLAADGGPMTVAVSAERAAVMHASLAAGGPVQLPEEETVAAALAGGIGLSNRYSFPLVRDLVVDHAMVTEDEIRAAMAYAATALHVVVEGGGAVALAALLAGTWTPPPEDGPVVVVLSGGNVSASLLAEMLGTDDEPPVAS